MKQTPEQLRARVVPTTGFLRLRQVLEVFPVSKTTWWDGIASGKYPRPVKLSERVSAWRVQDIHRLIRDFGGE